MITKNENKINTISRRNIKNCEGCENKKFVSNEMVVNKSCGFFKRSNKNKKVKTGLLKRLEKESSKLKSNEIKLF